jgi:hypothetical protein
MVGNDEHRLIEAGGCAGNIEEHGNGDPGATVKRIQ